MGPCLCRAAGRRKGSRPLVVEDVGAYQTAEWHDLGCRPGAGVKRGGGRGARAGAPQGADPPRPPSSTRRPRWPPRNDAGMPACARGVAVTAEPRRATISYPAWPGYPARRRRAYLRRPPARPQPSAFLHRAEHGRSIAHFLSLLTSRPARLLKPRRQMQLGGAP